MAGKRGTHVRHVPVQPVTSDDHAACPRKKTPPNRTTLCPIADDPVHLPGRGIPLSELMDTFVRSMVAHLVIEAVIGACWAASQLNVAVRAKQCRPL